MSRRDRTDEATVGCPFYLWSDDDSLSCEGHCEGMRTVSKFHRAEDKRAYVQRRCVERYRLCPVYQAAMVKYQD